MTTLLRRLFITVSLCSLALAVTGCSGYKLGNIPDKRMTGVKTIYLPMVRNETLESTVTPIVTEAILERMDEDGTYQSSRQKNADAELVVTIVKFVREPVRQSRADTNITIQYRAILTANCTLTNNRTGEVVFRNALITGESEYVVQTDMTESERQNLPLVSKDLAYNIITRVAEGW
jgi:hypothetical protein